VCLKADGIPARRVVEKMLDLLFKFVALPFLGANSWKPASQRDLPGTTPGDYC